MKSLIGQQFNRLTVLSKDGLSGTNRLWTCRCSCGKIKKVATYPLRAGKIKSCGCLIHDMLIKRNTTHGMTDTRTFKAWMNMRARMRPSFIEYHRYGGRGIKIAPEWEKFENFLADMGEAPAGMSLDRIDNNGNYCKQNCRWADAKTQRRNTSKSHYVEAKGERRTIAEWAEITRIKQHTIIARLGRGWAPEEAISVPPLGHGFTLRQGHIKNSKLIF